MSHLSREEGGGPGSAPRTRPLQIPRTHAEKVDYAIDAQKFYGDRCPTYFEFRAFLAANLDWVFDEGSFYECSMSMCSGSPVGEGYSTDLVIPASATWYRQFEAGAGQGRARGRDLLAILSRIRP